MERKVAPIDPDVDQDVPPDDQDKEPQLPLPTDRESKKVIEPYGSGKGEKATLEERKATHQMKMEESLFNAANGVMTTGILLLIILTLLSNWFNPPAMGPTIETLKAIILTTVGYQFSERRHKNN